MSEYLTTSDAAELLKVTITTVQRWIQSGKLKAYQLPGERGKYRIKKEDLVSLLEPVEPNRDK